MRRGVYRVIAGSVAICLALSLAPYGASAKSHGRGLHLEVLGCLTGSLDVSENSHCRVVPEASEHEDSRSGLAGVVALLAGREGKSLYTVGNKSNSLTQLKLGPAAGRLVFGACFTGDSFLRECTNVPGAQANAFQSPIAEPTAAAISPDGRSLYVTSGDFHGAAVARFARDPLTGALTYVDCLSGDRGAGPGGTAACSLIPSATRDGYGSGLYEPSGIAVGANGQHVYVTAALDQSVVAFTRDPATGALAFNQCVSSNPKATVCAQVPKGGRVLDEVSGPLIASGGRFLYTAATRAGTVDTFAIRGDGSVAYVRCLTGATGPKQCERGGARTGGPYTLQSPVDLTETSDGRFVYVSSSYGSIVVLRRSPASGRLSPASCISGFAGDKGKCTLVPRASRLAAGSPLYGVHTPVLSRNGKTMFVAARGEDGITELDRDTRTGALTFLARATGNLKRSTAGKGVCTALPGATANGTGSGFLKTGVLARGPGNLLYAAAPRDSTVTVLRP